LLTFGHSDGEPNFYYYIVFVYGKATNSKLNAVNQVKALTENIATCRPINRQYCTTRVVLLLI